MKYRVVLIRIAGLQIYNIPTVFFLQKNFLVAGSQLVKKDKDGCTIKAYTLDGVQYQHTHLDLKSLSQSSLAGSNAAISK